MKRIKRMPADEARFCRREIINFCLHEIALGNVVTVRLFPVEKLSFTKSFVREYETSHYGRELDVYRHKTL